MRVWRWVVTLVVAAGLGVVSWSVPAQPTGPAPVAAQVTTPWQPGEPELGVQIYWVDEPADDLDAIRTKARRAFDTTVGLEANSVAISFPFYVAAIDASEVYGDPTTPSPERLAVVVEEAQRSGLRVTVRPLLDEYVLSTTDPQDWRGRLDPADRAAWFDSYIEFLRPYLELAEQERVESFAIGVEFGTLQDDPGWARVVEAARASYGGELTYSANWDAYAGAVAGVPADVVGIDAYPILGVTPTDSEDELTRAWISWLGRVLGREPTLLTEVGAAAEARTVENPAVPEREGEPLDVGVQARWFAAACRAAQDQELTGLYWWRLPLEAESALADPVADRHDSFLGRPAQDATRECFANWGRP